MSLQEIQSFFSDDLWRRSRYEQHGRFSRIGISTLQVLTLCVRGFNSKNLNIRANALTYSLMFAIVPILAMVLAVAQGFGVDDIIEQKLEASFLGEYHMVPIIMGFVERYMETAQGGVFVGVGLLILLWAIYSFFDNVESAFNAIWNVKRSRSISRQLITYISVLFLVPIMMVVSSGLLGYVEYVHISAILPYATSWIIFTWMYWAIPNTKVGFWASIVPGVLVGTCYQVLQWALVHFVVILGRTSIVYGAFAAIPILLMVLQWSCLLILIGAQLSFSIQSNELFEYQHDIDRISSRYSDFLTLFLTRLIINRFRNDETPLTAHEIAEQQHIPMRLVNQLLGRLVDIGILREMYVEGKEEKTYQPAMDPARITLGLIEERRNNSGSEWFLRHETDEMIAFRERYLRLRNEHSTKKEITVEDI